MTEPAKVPDLLLVDDTPMNLGVLSEMLRSAGYRIRIALNGRKALEAAALQRPDLVLMDITMPELDGYEACAALKANPDLAQIPVIFLSAHDHPLDKVRAFEVGGADYIQKPYQAAEVLARIAHHLRLANLQAALEHRNRDLEESNERLAELDRMKSRFAAMLVHDLRNPLTAVMASLELIENLPPEQQLESLPKCQGRCRDHLQRCLAFLEDLLQVYRADAKGLQLHPQTLDGAAFLRRMMETHAGPSEQAGLHLELSLVEPLSSLPGDPVQLERALDNLLANARKFTPAGGRIMVAADMHAGEGVDQGRTWFRVRVSDTGRGIPPEAIPFVFDPYQQALPGDAAQGSGLGLAIVARVVAAHHGRVAVQSQEGIGTTFTLLLPA